MPYDIMFHIDEKSRELMEREHPKILAELRRKYCSNYRADCLIVTGLIWQVSDITDTITAFLAEKDIKHEKPRVFETVL